MYSLRWSWRKVRKHLEGRLNNILPCEAFVLTVFTAEKVLRRTLLQVMVSAGFTTGAALSLMKRIQGIDAIKKNWNLYDPKERKLSDIIDNADWKIIVDASEERNALVHGVGHKQEKFYKSKVPPLLDALNRVHNSLGATYGYSGWKGFKERSKSALHSDPKVKI